MSFQTSQSSSDNFIKPKMNQAYVFPNHCLIPRWVEERLNAFHNRLKNDTLKYSNLNILKDNIKENLEENILYDFKISKPLDKKIIGNILKQYDKTFSNGVDFMWWYYLLMQAGFTLSSVIPTSFQPEALMLPDEFKSEKDAIILKYNNSKKTPQDAIQFQDSISLVANKVKKYFEEKDIYVVDMMNSGAKGNTSHIQSLLLAVGLSIDSYSEINDVIENSHSEGMTQTQFFNNSSQGIQALYSKSSETSKPGYLGRKLSSVGENIKLSKDNDCGSQRFFELKVQSQDVAYAVTGRVQKTALGLSLIKDPDDVMDKLVKLRSPLYCKSKDGICKTCFGPDYVDKFNLIPGANIGLLASTGLTSELVNLTLKKSHVGVGLDKVEVDLREEFKKMS